MSGVHKYDTATFLRGITPSATEDLPDGVCRAVWVGTGGDLEVVAEEDSTGVTFTNIPDGTLILVRAKAVRNGTTATDLVAMY